MNLSEDRGEDYKGKIINLIQNDPEIDATNARFHAVHRGGKATIGKTRSVIIARSVGSENRDLVSGQGKKIRKNSTIYQDAYIMQDRTTYRTMLKPFNGDVTL